MMFARGLLVVAVILRGARQAERVWHEITTKEVKRMDKEYEDLEVQAVQECVSGGW